MRASDIFEDARDASWELFRHDLRYNAMERIALSLGASSEVKVSSGSIRDRMSAVDGLVDYGSMMERREAEWCRRIDLAESILYGTDWEHGIASSLGLGYAEVLECIYIQRMSLSATATRTKFSKSTVQRMRRRAFGHIDRVGADAAIAGR
jgi:hypothetical protein